MTTDNEEQEERRRIIREQGSTNLDHARAQADELSQGRWSTTGTPNVTGTTPIPSYPVGNQWAAADQNLEPPFPVDISEMQPTGEPHEVRQSLEVAPTLEPLSILQVQGNSGDPTAAPSTKSPGLMPKRVGSSLSDEDDPPEAA